MTHTVRFMRILGRRTADKPVVLAFADEHKVTWTPRHSWHCECGPQAGTRTCSHITAVQSYIDPRVTNPHPRSTP